MSKTGYFQIFRIVLRREWDFLLNVRRKFFYFCLLLTVASFFILIGVFNTPVIRQIPIAVVDNNVSNLSKELTMMLEDSPYLKVTHKLADVAEAKELIKEMKIYGVVIIPREFSEKVLGYKGANVPLYYNNQMLLLGGLVNKGVVSVVKAFSDSYNVTYEESDGVPVYAASAKAQPLIFNDKVLFNPYLNYQYFMFLGLFPSILQLFIVGSLAYSFGFELKTGRAEVLRKYINDAPFTVTAAKSMPYWIIYLVTAVFMLYLLFIYIGTPLKAERYSILLATFFFVIASSSMGSLILALSFGNLRIALSATAIYAAPAFAYAGITFPYMGMPALAKAWSEFLPITHYHRILINEAMRGAAHSSTPMDMLYLCLFASVSFVLTAILYRIFVDNPRFWGQL